ncbi:TPA: hypothetical protein ON523_002858 [Morganella morganii]|nr:hypothetical protein [Morganella morganii]HCR4009062.1 hypothetical protein [Morganella morganii]
MKRSLTLLGCLLLSAPVFALRMPGEVQPDRYTYYLTPEYGQQLKMQNDGKDRKPAFQPLPAGELRSETRADLSKGYPAPVAMTCISSIYYNTGARANWLKVGCIDNNGLEYETSKKWPPKSVAERVCKAGEGDCESFLQMDTDSWSGPQ